MTETVVRVSTIEEWKAVLDVWFEQGYEWLKSKQYHREDYFNKGSVLLGLNVQGKDEITYFSENNYNGDNLIEYADFMAQQKEGNNMETYYVTREQLDFIEELKDRVFPLSVIFTESNRYKKINVNNTSSQYEKALLRYLGGDETIEFKCKEQLYRLGRIDSADDKVYMTFNLFGTPSWTDSKHDAFTAPLEEIKKWKTIAWEVEEVD